MPARILTLAFLLPVLSTAVARAQTNEQLRRELEAARREAAAAKAEAEKYHYLRLIEQAQREWSANNVLRANELLQQCPKGQRGWEWHYLQRLFRGGLLTLAGSSWVAYSPDGKRLASGGMGPTVKVWDAANGRELKSLTGHAAAITRVAFSPDGHRLASGDGSGVVQVWDATTGNCLVTLQQREGWVSGLAYSPDGKWLAAGYTKGTLQVFDAQSGQTRFAVEASTWNLLAVAYSPDGRHIATAGDEAGTPRGPIKLWDAASGRLRRTLPGHESFVNGLAFSPDGKRLVSGGFDDQVRIWDVASGNQELGFVGHLATIAGYPAIIQCVAYSPDGRRIASAAGDPESGRPADVKVWDAVTGRVLFTLRGHTGSVGGVAFSPGGQRLATAGRDGAVKIWDISSDGDARVLRGDLYDIFDVAFSPDGRRLAVAMDEDDGCHRKALEVWDADTGQTLYGVEEDREVKAVAFSSDGRWLAYGNGQRVKVLDTAKWGRAVEMEAAPFLEHVSSLAFSPDGKRLASAVTAHLQGNGIVDPQMLKFDVCVWEVPTGKRLFTLAGPVDGINAVAYSPDGKYVASGGEDGTVRVWDGQTGRSVHTQKGHRGSVYAIAFSPDGTQLACAGELPGPGAVEGVRLWNTATGEELLTLQGLGGRVASLSFSPDGRRLATAREDGTVDLWDPRTGEETLTLTTANGVDCVRFAPDGTKLLAASSHGVGSGQVVIWDAKPRE
jgi:WD40 repeat protein